MGMFDWYEPFPMPTCRECDELMTSCQGKDGPNFLSHFRQGDVLPAIDPSKELIVWPEGFDLRRDFRFTCWCPNDHQEVFIGEIEEGAWVRTVAVPVPLVGSRTDEE